MSKLDQQVLRHDVRQAESNLLDAEQTHGKASPEYSDALKRFARLWSVLKMTRRREEFFQEVHRLTAEQRN